MMTATELRPLHLAHARLLDPVTGLESPGGVLVSGGRIADFSPDLAAPGVVADAGVLDCAGRLVLPGLVDLRAFIGEPGEEYRETLRSASEAAAAGGVTTVVAQPNTSPVIDDPAVVDFVLRRARDTGIVHIRVAAALTKGCRGQEMSEIGLLKEAGAVAVTDGDRPVTNAQVMRRSLTYARIFDMPVIHHVEDPNLVGEGVMNEGEFATRLGLPGIPRAAETIMLERDMRLVQLTGGRYHAAMITCRESLDVIRRAKQAGLPVTAGVSINHLTLNEMDIGGYRTFLKLRPPLRSEEDRLAMVEALAEGLVDIIVSDHNPQDVETKRLTFAECEPGAIGLETMLSAGLQLVESGLISLQRLLEAMSAAPARLAGLETGRMARGAPADLIVLDRDYPWVVEAAGLRSKCKNTPFDEARLSGKVFATLVAGRIVHRLS
ncbi:MAG: dihydroorotase [Beijerinckiaceae bacterium]|nr:dihydroorotase [Beijerinckiaceae bacterium]